MTQDIGEGVGPFPSKIARMARIHELHGSLWRLHCDPRGIVEENRELPLSHLRHACQVTVGNTTDYVIGSEMMPLADVGQANGFLEMAPATWRLASLILRPMERSA